MQVGTVRSSSSLRATARIAALLASTFTLLCTIQAAYWPLINKPGTSIAWWQNRALARVGDYLGLPALALMIQSPLGGSAQTFVVWAVSLLWAVVVYFAVAALARFLLTRLASNAG